MFWRNFVKNTCAREREFSKFPHCEWGKWFWKLTYSHAFLVKISFTKEITKEMIWRNIISVIVSFSFYHTFWRPFHSVQCNFYKSLFCQLVSQDILQLTENFSFLTTLHCDFSLRNHNIDWYRKIFFKWQYFCVFFHIMVLCCD